MDTLTANDFMETFKVDDWGLFCLLAIPLLLFGLLPLLCVLAPKVAYKLQSSDSEQRNYEEEITRIARMSEDSEERDYFSEFYAIITENKKLLDELPPERIERAKYFLSLFEDDGEAKISRELLKRKERDLYKWNPRDAASIIDLHYRKEARILADQYKEFISES